ncbi:TRAUB-domain-containing protein [Meira miltonrushii]|uniref:Protein BFR2 n=1 Tax=Meira miltonrushii TaxID=1280837 RepID=A0A316VKM1_9BASI|nr:TRAUB-domain-containing protein [Meira miltonrushii]PWN36065.1 TRAUB-domain-containing protein [Meira miltonrushii]
MPARTSSLAAELAELGNATPYDDGLDSDPEALDAGKRQGEDDDEEEDEEDLARNHARHNMVHVEPSKMRKQANFIESMDDETMNKYQGVKATRKEMMGEDDESEDEEEDQSDLDDEELGSDELEGTEDEDLDDSEEDDDEEDESMDESTGDMSESEGDGSLEPKATGKKLRFAEDVDDKRQTPKENGKKSAAQSDATLLAELKQRSSEDAARGRDARKQIDAWGKLLGTRIRAQKVVRSAGRISTKAMASYISDLEKDGEERSALEDSLDALDQLSSHLFKAQQSILSSYASTSETGSTLEALAELQGEIEKQIRPNSRKRKVEDDDHLNDQIALLMRMHEDVYSPMWKDVLSKWSWRTSNATMEDKRKAKSKFDSSSAVGSSNGLKAIEQSAEEQIQRGMTGEAFERLRKRTRVWRGTDNESRIDVDDQEGSDDEEDDSTNNAANAENADVFDDSDFYAALLRELIDNKGGLSTTDAEGSAASASWAQAAKRAAKKHRVVDRNASKGRRLRFDVHEKVQSFMPPIPSETWSVEQIDRLMRQLRNTYGNGKVASADGEEGVGNHADEDEDVKAPAEVALDGLRLFG